MASVTFESSQIDVPVVALYSAPAWKLSPLVGFQRMSAPAPARIRLPKVGVEVVAMSCGVESVIVPAPLVTVTWLTVPVIVARTGSVVPSPIGICPFAATPSAVMAPVPEPSNIPPSVNVAAPVPPIPTSSVPVEKNDVAESPVKAAPASASPAA